MRVYGVTAEEEAGGYLRGGKPLCHQAQHFDFASGEIVWVGFGGYRVEGRLWPSTQPKRLSDSRDDEARVANRSERHEENSIFKVREQFSGYRVGQAGLTGTARACKGQEARGVE